MSKAAELAALIGSQTALSNRNLIINGAMQVAQRGTSSTDFFYASVDRFQLSKNATDQLAMTQSQDSDTPAGQGFGSSFKVNITTAESALDANENLNFHQRIEGQNLQQLKKGTSNAESSTLSFWVKSNTTGTYVLELFDNDNSRHAAKTYTIDSADTWEKKILTFAGDTTGALGNDANRSMDVRWWLAAGSNFTSGTLPTGWASLTSANRAVGQVNLMASTNNWYITGIQWEVGEQETPFEHRSFGDELARCQRYYEKSYGQGTNPGTATAAGIMQSGGAQGNTTTGEYAGDKVQYVVVKRTTPTLTIYDGDGTSAKCTRVNFGVAAAAGQDIATGNSTNSGFNGVSYSGGAASGIQFHFEADAEL